MTSNRKNTKLIAILLFIALIGLYGYSKSSDFLRGPAIVVKTPTDNETIDGSFTTVTGQAKRITKLYLNDYQIFTDKDGYFNESLLLLPGYNILKLRAEDDFERAVVKIIELVSKN